MPRVFEEDLAHQVQEMDSEIRRHHKLILEMREGLEWALAMIHLVGHRECSDDWYLHGDDEVKYDKYERLLNREVS